MDVVRIDGTVYKGRIEENVGDRFVFLGKRDGTINVSTFKLNKKIHDIEILNENIQLLTE